MTSSTPAPRWAAGDKAMVEIVDVATDVASIRGNSERDTCWIGLHRLRPLPSATAEDEAPTVEEVRRALTTYYGTDWQGSNLIPMTAALREFVNGRNAIRSRRAAQDGAQGAETKDSAPAIKAAREAVCAEFLKLLTPDGNLKLAVQPYSNAYPAVAALVALRALLTPQPPPDPVAEARAAFAALDEALPSAPGPLMDRLRSAIAAMEART